MTEAKILFRKWRCSAPGFSKTKAIVCCGSGDVLENPDGVLAIVLTSCSRLSPTGPSLNKGVGHPTNPKRQSPYSGIILGCRGSGAGARR
jgi:hypothetical protein